MLPAPSFVPDTATLLAYSAACFVLFVTPGPDMSLFLAKTLSGGRRSGFAAMLGALTGCCVHTVLAALGLSALLAASPNAFLVLKIMGAVYLLWLAREAVVKGSVLSLRDDKNGPETFVRIFWMGVGINLSNPKVVLFFVTFLPQFIAPHDPYATGKLVFLGLYFVVFAAPLAALMIVGAEPFLAMLRRHPRLLRVLDYSLALLFCLFALRIVLTKGV
jgi:threonine/homoserine/homoserine lactone efflux protein